MRNVFSVLVLLFLSVAAIAQAGALDPSFGDGGIVKMVIGDKANALYENPRKIFIQKDGKLLTVVEDNHRVFLMRRLADGSLDSTYGDSGISDIIPFQNPCAAAIQPDESVVLTVAALFAMSSTPADFQLVRINREGRLDTTFGTYGRVRTDFGYKTEAPASIAIQKDGKIVVAGTASHDTNSDGVFAIARYNIDGSLDSTFGANGKVTTDFGRRTVANAIAIEDGGKIVVAGTAYNTYYAGILALARYNPDGSLDSFFGTEGKILTPAGFFGVVANSMAIDNNGNIVLACTSYISYFSFKLAIVRFTSSGSFDYSLNNSGYVFAEFDYAVSAAQDMLLQADNKIVIGGYITDSSSFQFRFAISRFDTNGNFDTTFNGNGKAVCTFEGHNQSQIYSLALQPDQKIVATGFALDKSARDIALVRYKPNGVLDENFGQGGKITDYITAHRTSTNQLFVQRDGKTVVATTVFNGDSTYSVLIRYTTNGAIDTLFSQNGLLYLTGRPARTEVLQTDDKIVTGSYNYDYTEYTLYRYSANGTIDSSYGQQGKKIIFSGRFNGINGIQIQGDNKLVVLSYSFPPGVFAPVYNITRYTNDGALDESFGNGGKIQLDAAAYILRIQQDGKIVITGYEYLSDPIHYTIRRYTVNGAVDASYGQNGKVTLDFSISDLAFQRSGDLIVSGGSGIWPNFYNLISRVTADGVVDSTFGQAGKAYVTGGLSTIQDDDKILVAGSKKNVFDYSDIVISRLTNNGAVDSTFGRDGIVEMDVDSKRDDYISQLRIFENRLYVSGNSSSIDEYGWLMAYKLNENTPALKCPSDKTVSTDKGVCFAKVYDIDPAGVPANSVLHKLTGATQGAGTGSASGKTFNKGVTYVTYFLQSDTTRSCTFTVTVNDTEAPVLNRMTLSSIVVWPSNGNLHDITINYDALDNCGVASLALSVTDNAGNTVLNWDVVNAHRLRLHADQLLAICGKTFTVTVTCTDLSGNTATKSITFTMPACVVNNSDVSNLPLQITAFPNPGRSRFVVQIQSGNPGESINVRVLNSATRVIEVRKVKANSVLQLGAAYSPGIYYVEAEQGGKKVITKLIKLPH